MPGLVGIIGQGPCRDVPMPVSLRTMIDCMIHNPSYAVGALIREKQKFAVGWVSHKGSFSDCMPAWNRSGDICLIFAGEENSDSSTNAKCLVHRYEELGSRFFESLNGVFSGLIINLKNCEITIFTDRYGLGRLYYHQNENGCYFASEAKSLLKILPSLRRLDMNSFAESFSCGAVMQNRSLFKGISLLPAASAWTFTPDHAVKKRTYFDWKELEGRTAVSAPDYYERMTETFGRILPNYFRGEQEITLSLTGGLDSRMIMASAMPAASSLPCHTFGGMYRECADVTLAKRIASTARQHHKTITVTRDFLSQFPTLAEQAIYISDGTMDVTGSVELFVNRIAREMAPIRLTGNYGSEILRDHIALRLHPLHSEMFNDEFVPFLQTAALTYANERNVSTKAFVISKQLPWHHYGRLSVEQSQLTVRSPYLDNELVALSYEAPSDRAENTRLAHRFIIDRSASLAKIPTDRGGIGSLGQPAGKVRHFFREFIPRVEYAYDYGMPQWLAKIDCLLRPLHMEKLLLGRQKFYHFRIWYRDQLSRYVKEVLLDPRSLSRPYLSRRRVETLLLAHLAGRANYTREIHKLLTTELLVRKLIEQK